jgi:hypothetical protein
MSTSRTASLHLQAEPGPRSGEAGRAGWGCARTRRSAACIGLFLLVSALVGCSSSKKLSNGGAMDTIAYDWFDADRNPSYYYELVKDSHDRDSFAYRPSSDPFLVDKNVDAVQRLGKANFARLGGEAEVVALLTDVVLEDRAALAQANAANSLTRIGLKLPQYRSQGREERGDIFLALLKEMDAMNAPAANCAVPAARQASGNRAARGRPAVSRPYVNRERMIQILDAIGNMEMATLQLSKDSLKPFYTRDYLIDATDTGIREASDTALVKRMAEVIRLALRASVDADVPFVREEAIRGLKTLGDRGALDAVLARLDVEANWRVRREATEYLGRVPTANSVGALLPLLVDGDPTLRLKSRQSLTRIAGRDLGIRQRTWQRWAYQQYPVLAQRAAEAEAEARELAELMR